MSARGKRFFARTAAGTWMIKTRPAGGGGFLARVYAPHGHMECAERVRTHDDGINLAIRMIRADGLEVLQVS